MNERGAAPARTAPKETAAAKLDAPRPDSTADADNPGPRAHLAAAVRDVMEHRWDARPLDRLVEAVARLRPHVAAGMLDRTAVVAALTLAAE